MRYVIIGNSTAAIAAVEGIRRVDAQGAITLVADEAYPTYSRPLISYYLEGRVAEQDMGYRPPDFYARQGVQVRLGVRAERVEASSRRVVLEDGGELEYDRLLIATGSRPLALPVPGLERPGVFHFNRFDDVRALARVAAPRRRAAVVGAGLTGVKAAEALVRVGVHVTLVDLAPYPLSAVLDPAGGEMVRRRLEAAGVTLRMGCALEEFVGDSRTAQVFPGEWQDLKEKYRRCLVGQHRLTGVRLQDGSSLQVDFAVVAAGVVPNVEVAEGTGVEIHRGILVNERMETSVEGIYAAGDVAEGWDLVRKERRIIATLPNAYRQGEIAGVNMAGGNLAFAGGVAMNSVNVCGLHVASAGLSNAEGPELEVMVESDPPHWRYRRITLREGRLAGFACIGNVGRAGILTALIRAEVDVRPFQLRLLDEGFGLADLPEPVRRQWDWERGERSWASR